MKKALAVTVAVLLLGGLLILINMAPQKKPGGFETLPQTPAPASRENAALDVGDAEATFHIDAVIDPRSQAANVKEEQLTNALNVLDLVTVEVAPPVPGELWVTFNVAKKRAMANAVGIRAKIFRDKEQKGAFSGIITNADSKSVSASINVLAGEAPAPGASMLVHAQAELFLIKPGDNPAEVNADTYPVAPGEMGHLLSNPVRIDFKAGEAKP
jgi:hypothetical protein